VPAGLNLRNGKEWAATAPLRELVEQVVWNTAKGGVE
jgi:hypothetical protein